MPLLENFEIVAEVASVNTDWKRPNNSSMNGAHNNYRYVNSDFFHVFINSSLDSVIVCNNTKEYVTRFPIPILNGSMVALLYFHNPDSIFLFFDRQFIYHSRNAGRIYSDFILCNGNGQIVNEYSLDAIPHIYNGQINPLVYINPMATTIQLIQNNRLYIPFVIHAPEFDDIAHKNLKIKLLCEYNLQGKSLQMLNISVPDDLIGKHFNSEYARNCLLNLLIINDSLLVYHIYTHGSVYQYNLNTHKSKELFSADIFPFRNNLKDDPASTTLIFFEYFKYSSKEKVFLRSIVIEEYKDFNPFRFIQLFDENFQVIGYHIYGSGTNFKLHNEKYGPYFFDHLQHLAIRQQGKYGDYYQIRHGTTTIRSVDYIEMHYLTKKEDVEPLRLSSDLSYEKRLVMYLQDLSVPKGTKVIMIGLNDACVHCLEFLLKAHRKNEAAFKSQKISYLFIGQSADQVLTSFNIPGEMVLIDEQKVYQQFFTLEEQVLYPLIHYKEDGEVEVIIYDFRSCAKDLERFLELRF